MKWNGRPDPGERTQRRVHRNEGHSLPRDGNVSRAGPAGSARPADISLHVSMELLVMLEVSRTDSPPLSMFLEGLKAPGLEQQGYSPGFAAGPPASSHMFFRLIIGSMECLSKCLQ